MQQDEYDAIKKETQRVLRELRSEPDSDNTNKYRVIRNADDEDKYRVQKNVNYELVNGFRL